MTAAQMLDELAVVTAERDRARDLAAALEQELALAGRVVEAVADKQDVIARHIGALPGKATYAEVKEAEARLRRALAAYEASR